MNDNQVGSAPLGRGWRVIGFVLAPIGSYMLLSSRPSIGLTGYLLLLASLVALTVGFIKGAEAQGKSRVKAVLAAFGYVFVWAAIPWSFALL